MFASLEYGNDSLPLSEKVRYQNANEDFSRLTNRPFCVDLWKICGVDKCDLISELDAPVKNIDFTSSKWLILFNFPCLECKVIVV